MGESGVGVIAADNWKISVSLHEDSDFNISVTEIHRNSDISVVIVVDVLDLVGGPGSVHDVAVVNSSISGGIPSTIGVGSERISSKTFVAGETGSTENLGKGVDKVDTSAGILLVEVGTRVGGSSVVGRIVFPVNVGAHDGTTSQLFHQLSTAPLRFVGNAGKSGKAVDSLAGLRAASLVLQFGSRDGGGEKCQSRQKLSENHGFFGFIYSREADC